MIEAKLSTAFEVAEHVSGGEASGATDASNEWGVGKVPSDAHERKDYRHITTRRVRDGLCMCNNSKPQKSCNNCTT